MMRYVLATISLLLFFVLLFSVTSTLVYHQMFVEFTQGFCILQSWSWSSKMMFIAYCTSIFLLILRRQLLPLVFLIHFRKWYPIPFSLIWKSHRVKICKRKVLRRRKDHICNFISTIVKMGCIVKYVTPLHLP